jgi:hypothetical protein
VSVAAHCAVAVQGPPIGCKPQVRLPPQVAGAKQLVAWLAVVQLVLHAPPQHVYGAQLVGAGVTHVPVPLHVEAAMRIGAVGEQLAATH